MPIESSLVLKARLELARRHCPKPLSAEDVIKKALNDFADRACVAWSGGKCSTVVLHMALKMDPKIRVMFNNTGVEYPETVKYVREIADKWRLNYFEVHPRTTFWKIAKRHGFPQLRGMGKGRPRRPACCWLLKEKPAQVFYGNQLVRGVLTGIRAEENRSRAFSTAQHGQYYFAKRERISKFHPIALWSYEEMDAYIKKAGIPVNPIYDLGILRCGCWPCTGFLSWREQLKKTRPRLYQWLNKEYQKSVGEPTLWEFQDDDSCRQGYSSTAEEL